MDSENPAKRKGWAITTKGYITEAHNPLETIPLDDRTITIHTDGACIGNPGPGGWGVVLQSWNAGDHLRTRTLSGGEPDTTNNRMELKAAIEGLKALKRKDRPVTVFSDSKYVVDGITSWIEGWKAKGWKSSNRKPVKNVDLWQELDTLANEHGMVLWQWVKGHAGDPGNEQADGLANAEAMRRQFV